MSIMRGEFVDLFLEPGDCRLCRFQEITWSLLTNYVRVFGLINNLGNTRCQNVRPRYRLKDTIKEYLRNVVRDWGLGLRVSGQPTSEL